FFLLLFLLLPVSPDVESCVPLVVSPVEVVPLWSPVEPLVSPVPPTGWRSGLWGMVCCEVPGGVCSGGVCGDVVSGVVGCAGAVVAGAVCGGCGWLLLDCSWLHAPSKSITVASFLIRNPPSCGWVLVRRAPPSMPKNFQ